MMVNSFNVFLKHFLRAFCLDPSPFYNWVICFLDSVFACLFVLILLTHLCQVSGLPRFSPACEFLLHLLDCFLSCAGIFKFCEAYKLVQPLWKSVWRIFQKSKNKSTIWPSYTTPWHTWKILNILLHGYLFSSVLCCPIYNNQEMQTI